MMHHEQPMVTYLASKSFFVESGTYQQPALRTYQTHYDDVATNNYLNKTQYGDKIVPNAFADISSSILTPSAAPSALIGIDHGWNERRMSFIIEVLVPDRLSGDTRSIVLTGYTDRADVSPFTKQFDPNMKLYLNTSTIIDTITQRSPTMGIVKRRVMTDSSHLLDRNAMMNIQRQNATYQSNDIWYATPRNVINEMNNIQGSQMHDNNYFDFRSRSNQMELQRSRRENAVPTTYLSQILRGVHNNLSKMSYGVDEDEYTALDNAAAGVADLQNQEDPVLMDILIHAGYQTQGYTTWGQLCSIIPNLSDETYFTTRAAQVVRTNTPDAESGNFNHWNGVGHETVIANSISQLIPALMTSCMIGTVNFVFNNDNITLTPTIAITSGQTMIDGIAITQVSSQFESRFLTEIAPQITDQGRTLVHMIVQCSLGTETFITISRNGEPEVPFCAPTFCDSLYTPILSTTQQGLTDIASDLQNIANSVNTAATAANYAGQLTYNQ